MLPNLERAEHDMWLENKIRRIHKLFYEEPLKPKTITEEKREIELDEKTRKALQELGMQVAGFGMSYKDKQSW